MLGLQTRTSHTLSDAIIISGGRTIYLCDICIKTGTANHERYSLVCGRGMSGASRGVHHVRALSHGCRQAMDAAARSGKAKPGPKPPARRRRQQSSSFSNASSKLNQEKAGRAQPHSSLCRLGALPQPDHRAMHRPQLCVPVCGQDHL